jgi:hypothetical protein
MSRKLIPNKFVKLYDLYVRKHKIGCQFDEVITIQDVIRIMDKQDEPTDKLFTHSRSDHGIQLLVLSDLKKFLNFWYEKDPIFAKKYKSKIFNEELEMNDYLQELKKIRGEYGMKLP